MQIELKRIERELQIRDYSTKTIKVYLYALGEYFSFKNHDYQKLDQDNIRDFLFKCKQKQISAQSRNLFLNAIKFYYRSVLKKSDRIDIHSAKKPKSLPVVLSRGEINKIIESCKNSKHKMIVSLAYGGGLRVSEVIDLRVKDLNLEEFTLHIKQAKGQKDRISLIPELILLVFPFTPVNLPDLSKLSRKQIPQN
jgi:site-specific recombinase XerD